MAGSRHSVCLTHHGPHGPHVCAWTLDETQCGECQWTAPRPTSQLSCEVGVVIVTKKLGKLKPIAGTLLTLSEPGRDLKDASPGHQADFLRGLCVVSLLHIASTLVVPYPRRLPGCPDMWPPLEVIAIH